MAITMMIMVITIITIIIQVITILIVTMMDMTCLNIHGGPQLSYESDENLYSLLLIIYIIQGILI